MGQSVGQVARDNAAQPGVVHVLDRRALAEHAYIGVHAHVNQVRQAELGAERIHTGGIHADHIIHLGHLQAGLHAVPAVILLTNNSRPAHAAAVAERAAPGDRADLRHRQLGHGQCPLALRRAHIGVGRVGRGPDHRHPQLAGTLQRPVHPRHHRADTLSGRHTVVVVPHVDDNDADLRRIDALGDFCGRAGF